MQNHIESNKHYFDLQASHTQFSNKIQPWKSQHRTKTTKQYEHIPRIQIHGHIVQPTTQESTKDISDPTIIHKSRSHSTQTHIRQFTNRKSRIPNKTNQPLTHQQHCTRQSAKQPNNGLRRGPRTAVHHCASAIQTCMHIFDRLPFLPVSKSPCRPSPTGTTANARTPGSRGRDREIVAFATYAKRSFQWGGAWVGAFAPQLMFAPFSLFGYLLVNRRCC